MRSTQIFRALEQVSNRFLLCQLISQSAVLLHKKGNPSQNSLTDALQGIEAGKFRAESRIPVPAPPLDLAVEPLFTATGLL